LLFLTTTPFPSITHASDLSTTERIIFQRQVKISDIFAKSLIFAPLNGLVIMGSVMNHKKIGDFAHCESW
jgi:hypothetical protein